jgi:hypothetical protein
MKVIIEWLENGEQFIETSNQYEYLYFKNLITARPYITTYVTRLCHGSVG